MAGKGAMPKPADRLAGHGAAKSRNNQMTVIISDPVPQPPLPESMPGGEPWPAETLRWWDMWGSDPISDEFRATDWSELMDTALIHGKFWSGETRLAGELRLRAQRFGATAEDRARLRIQYAAADVADEKRRTSRPGADARGAYAGLRVAK